MNKKKLIDLSYCNPNYLLTLTGRCFFATIDGDKITMSDKFESRYGRNTKREIIETFSEVMHYNLLLESPSYSASINLGTKKEFTKNELVNIVKRYIEHEVYLQSCSDDYDGCRSSKEYYEEMYYDKLNEALKIIKKGEFTFEECWPDIISPSGEIYASKLIELRNEIECKNKKFAYLIKNLNNKKISDIKYVNALKSLFYIDNGKVLEIILNERFNEYQEYFIETTLKGSPSLTMLGYGSDFSYEMHETTKNFTVYAEKGTVIDENKVYNKSELDELISNQQLIVTEKNGKEKPIGISNKEFCEIIREHISKEQLLQGYLEFIDYCKIAKVNLEYYLRNAKNTKLNKSKELQDVSEIDDMISSISNIDEKEID